jgi:hypothetical protein
MAFFGTYRQNRTQARFIITASETRFHNVWIFSTYGTQLILKVKNATGELQRESDAAHCAPLRLRAGRSRLL